MQKENGKKMSAMMQKYLEKKKEYPDCILFYRLGDFYEMFFDDAVLASKLLEITLTGRDCGLEERAPMCGVPYHAADVYIAKLTDQGYKVAICEQLTPASTKQIIERDVVRIVTPGTVMDDAQLATLKNNFIASVSSVQSSNVGLSWIDLSTGEFYVQQFSGMDAFTKLNDTLVSIMPREVIADKNSCFISSDLQCCKMGIVPQFFNYEDDKFEFDNAKTTVLTQLNEKKLEKLHCENKAQAICAAGGLLSYLYYTQKRDLTHINTLKVIYEGHYMHLDVNTRLNLELCQTLAEQKKKGSLLWVLDKTDTPMGARLMRSYIEHPLQDSVEINDRLDGVEEFSLDTISRAEIHKILSHIGDIERICGRASYGNLNPKNCLALGYALSYLPRIKQLLSKFKSNIIVNCNENITDLSPLSQLLLDAIDEQRATTSIKDGDFIRAGFSAELDKCLEAKEKGAQWINELEAKERTATGIKNLRISYNRISGYFFFATKAVAENLPFRFQRIQTLTNGERFITTELKQLQETILSAEEQKLAIELRIFDELRTKIMESLTKIQSTSQQLAKIDCLVSLADVAIENNYSKPTINHNITGYSITNGRHPVVEQLIKDERFVPNDLLINDKQRTIIITGPNMAGKSTYMRQCALIVLLAHIGSFVPATSAEIAITDRIFTRIGASDNLGMGQSTFMVEMAEVSNILKNATQNSLLILDEIGRGTSSQDGFSIAWAVLEYIVTNIKARTLFATHYHKLTELQGKLPAVVNMRVTVSEFNNQMSFLRKIEYGSTNKSFGVEVAKLAGLPPKVIERAKVMLKSQLKEDDEIVNEVVQKYNYVEELTKEKYKDIEKTLSNVDINNLTPLEAMTILAELKNKIK